MTRLARPALALLMLALAAQPALAKDSISEPMPASPPDSLVLDPAGWRSPRLAEARSARATLGTLLVSGALIAVAGVRTQDQDGERVAVGALILGTTGCALGLVFGPAAGYTYGNVGSRGAGGIALRTGIVVLTPFVIADRVGRAQDYQSDERAGWQAAAVGFTALAASAVWDVTHVAAHVERRNRRIGQPAPLGFRVVPALTPADHSPALALRLEF